MADDSIDIVPPFDFHPCNSPRGMLYYDLNILTSEQQEKLNELKINTTREDEQYLAEHPEVRALIGIITREVLLCRPRTNIHEFVANFFARPKFDIHEEMKTYIADREPHIYEGDSAVIVHEYSEESVVYEEEKTEKEEEEIDIKTIPTQMIDEILDEAFKRLGMLADDIASWKDTTDTHSGLSVVQEVIKEVVQKAADKGEANILDYLSRLEIEQVEEEHVIPKEKYVLETHTQQEQEQELLPEEIIEFSEEDDIMAYLLQLETEQEETENISKFEVEQMPNNLITSEPQNVVLEEAVTMEEQSLDVPQETQEQPQGLENTTMEAPVEAVEATGATEE